MHTKTLNGPPDWYRQQVFKRLRALRNTYRGVRIVTPYLEVQLEEILSDILIAATEDLESSQIFKSEYLDADEANRLLSAVDQWASVASYAVSWLYAPQSPSPQRMAGWAKNIGSKLREIVGALLHALVHAAKALGASSWSIGVNFPLGISVSLSWS
ncbi:MAG: hypothetical protein ABSE82_06620 [Nitrososphaerales archaeon]|jgi:hypothetical protein